MIIFSKINTKTVIVFLIFITLTAIVLRFYKLPERQYWMVDEERDAFIVKKMLVDKHPTLIGGALPGGFYLAPGYFYISAFFYWFTNLNPVGMGYVAATLNVITIPIIFLTSLKMFGRQTSIFATIFYTFSYLAVIYNRTWWPLTLSPLVSIVSYFSLFQIVKVKNLKWLIPLTAALIVGVQSDPSSLAILATVVMAFLIYKISFKNQKVVLAIAALILSHLPLLIFDARHNFLNARAILKFFLGQTGAGINLDFDVVWQTLLLIPRNFMRFFWVFGDKDAALQVNPIQVYIDYKFSQIPSVLLIVATFILLYYLFSSLTNRKQIPQFIIALHILISLFGILLQNFFFGNWTYEWIVQVLFPAYAICAAIVLVNLIKTYKILIYPAIVLILIYGILSAKTILTSTNAFGLKIKLDAAKYALENSNGQDFSLDSIGTNYALGGYRYLFYVLGHEPVKSYMDPYFADWLYPKNDVPHPDRVVVIVNHEPENDNLFQKKYRSYEDKIINRKSFGRVEVLIVDNSQKWVDW